MNTKYVGVITIVIAGALVFFLYRVTHTPNKLSENTSPVTATTTTIVVTTPHFLGPLTPADTREYRNPLFHFSLFYPPDLEIKEYDDSTSASTVTFEDATGKKGFQIFIVPYGKDYIIKEQIKKDLPFGAVKEPIDIIIDGIRATKFFSADPLLGETREVWFIHNGFLYEITTSKELDSWFADIMQTWRFLQ